MTSKVVATNIPWTKLEDLEKQGYISFLRGSGISKKDFDEKGSFPCIHYGDLYTAYQKPEISEVVHRTNFDGKVRSHIGDVLVPATTTADEMGIAIARAINKKGVVLGSDINILRTENKYLLSTFLSYIFNYGIKRELASYAKGTNILHLSNKDIKKLSIPVPSLPEQKRIVEKLDKIFGNIDKAKEQATQNLKNAQDVFESTLHDIFSNISGEYKKLSQVVDIIGGGTPSKKNGSYYTGNIPWATVRDMNVEVLNETEFKITKKAVEESATNIIPKNNVIIATRVGLGKACILNMDTAINQDLKGLLPKKPLNTKFLYWWYYSVKQQVIDAGVGATVKGVKIPFIQELDFPYVDLKVQEKVASKISKVRVQTQELEKIYTKKLADLDELKQSVLQQAFSDKL